MRAAAPLSLILFAGLGACRADRPATTPVDPNGSVSVTPQIVKISGAVQSAVVFQTQTSLRDYAFQVQAYNPASLYFHGDAAPLAEVSLDTSAGNCPNDVCAYTLPEVDLAGCSLGLVVVVRPTDSASTAQWVPTGSGVGTPAIIAASAAAKSDIAGANVVVLSNDGLTRLSAATGKAAADFLSAGAFVGRIIQGSAGVSGAVATPQAKFTVSYYSSDLTSFDDAQGTANIATTASGFFLLRLQQPSSTSLPVSPLYTGISFTSLPGGDSLDEARAGVVPALVILYNFVL